MDTEYETINCLTEIVTIDPKRSLGGIPIERTHSLSDARSVYERCRVPSRLPAGKYFLVAHDDEIALLEQMQFGRAFAPHLSWIAETKRLLQTSREIYSDDLPIVVEQDLTRPCVHHKAPAYFCKLWRYMDRWKLENILQEGGLFLGRADRFDDDREGSLSFANLRYRSEVHRDDARMAQGYKRYCDELRNIKRHTYIGSWRIDETENARSWRDYTNAGDGVAIQTTYYKIWKRTQTIFCASVEYIDYDETWVVESNSVSPFMYKAKSLFEWEHEFRIIIQQFPRREWIFRDAPYFDCSQENGNDGLILRIDPKRFIDRIVTNPGASDRFLKEVKDFARKYAVEDLVTRSRFDE